MSELTDKIRSRGHWHVVIRPATFLAERIPYEQLDEVIPSIQVRMRGWPVPYADYGRRDLLRGEDWVGQDVDAEVVSMYEAWRLFMSGQFAHLRAVSADWRTGTEATRIPEGCDSVIEVWEIVYYLTEVFELAARLALGPAGDDIMVVSVALERLEGRGLVVGHSRRLEFLDVYKSAVPRLTREVEMPREKVVADGRAAAVEMAREFLLRFGWKPSVDQLADFQRELTERQ